MAHPRVLLDWTRAAARRSAATGIDRWDREIADRLAARRVVQAGGRLRAAAPRLPRWARRLAPPAEAPGIYVNLSHQGLEAPRLWHTLQRHRLRAVVAIHDLIPLHHPATTRPEQPARHAARLLMTLRHAAAVLCPSRAVACDLGDWARTQGLPAVPPVTVIPPGLSLPLDVPPVAAARPFVVMLATLEPRKGHAFLPDLWRGWAQAPDLVVIGQRGWRGDAIAAALRGAAELAGRMTLLEGADDATVAAHLAGAAALILPSRAEGWGLPVSEALAMQTPALCCDLPAIAESGQGLATCLPPPETGAAIRRWRHELETVMATRRRVTGYRPRSWDATATELGALLVEVAEA